MYNNNGGRRQQLSYFAEEKKRSNDPNFFRKVSDEDLRRQVKRIIKDIRFDKIEEQDYVYFSNEKILSACLYVTSTEYQTAAVIHESLQYYLNSVLGRNCDLSMQQSIALKRQIAANQCNKMNTKHIIWRECYNVFYGMSVGGEIMVLADYIRKLDQSMFREL